MNKGTELLNCMNEVSLFFHELDEPIKLGNKEIATFLHILSGVKDFRMPGKSIYKLENILAICFILAMKGEFTSFSYAAAYVKYYQDQFVEWELIEPGQLPSHDTFRRIICSLDANNLRDTFIDRIKEFLTRIASLNPDYGSKTVLLSGDGKTFNGSGRKNGPKNLNVFNIYSPSMEICYSSVPLTGKESEIPEFQRMLPKYNLANTIVTADALHCQRKTSETIVTHKGNYVFKVKNNQKELLKEIEYQFNSDKNKIISFSHNKCDYEFINLKKSYIGCDWPGQRTYIKMISHKRKGKPDYNLEPQYFISSANNNQLIAEAIDNRWQIEGSFHHFKDTVLNEDECTFMDKNAVKVVAVINNVVYSTYRLACAILGHSNMTETKIRFKHDPIGLISTVMPYLEHKNVSELLKKNMAGMNRQK